MNAKETKIIRCSSAEEATRTVRSLIGRRVHPSEIEVISSEPIHAVESLIAGKSRLHLFVISGAAAGILGGWLLASGTARLYPINTGGMPIVSFLPAGIVTYEVMMLLAILSCLCGLLFEAKLGRRRPLTDRASAECLGDGEILVLVRLDSSENIADLHRDLPSPGPRATATRHASDHL